MKNLIERAKKLVKEEEENEDDKRGVSINVITDDTFPNSSLDERNQEAIDVTVLDGMGNRIQINSRAGDIGSSVSINGTTVFNVGKGKQPKKPKGT